MDNDTDNDTTNPFGTDFRFAGKPVRKRQWLLIGLVVLVALVFTMQLTQLALLLHFYHRDYVPLRDEIQGDLDSFSDLSSKGDVVIANFEHLYEQIEKIIGGFNWTIGANPKLKEVLMSH